LAFQAYCGGLFDIVAFLIWGSSDGLRFSDGLDPITGNSLGNTKSRDSLNIT
jgi:hypothetical protein